MKSPTQLSTGFLLSAFLLFATPAKSEALLGGLDLDPGAGEPLRLIVPPTDVAIDGVERPQLGRSLADSLIAGLLQTGRFRVIDSADLALMSSQTADNALAHNLIKSANADVYLVSRLVGEFDYFHFTVREIDARTKEVVDVHQFSHKGSRDEIYDLVPQFLAEIGAPTALATPKQRQASNPLEKPARIREGGSTFYPLKPKSAPAHPQKQLPQPVITEAIPTSRIEVAVPQPTITPHAQPVPNPALTPAVAIEQPKPRVAYPPGTSIHRGIPVHRVPVGTIQLVNVPWKFCVIKPFPEADLEIYDRLEILTGMEETSFAKMYISKFDTGRIIADYGSNKWNRVIFPGETVYAWQDINLP